MSTFRLGLRLGGRAGGGGGAPSFSVQTPGAVALRRDHAFQVASRGPYGHVSQHSAFYDAVDDMTWQVFEGWDGSQRIVQCRLYDHGAGTWGPVYTVSTITLEDDAHGQPSAVMDSNGYVHVFHTAHDLLDNVQGRYSVTTTPRDPSTFTGAGAFGQNITYPSALVFDVGGTEHGGWLAREDLRTLLLRHAPIVNGEIDFANSTLTDIARHFAQYRLYPSSVFQKDGKIWVPAQRTDTTNTVGTAAELYLFVYDPNTGTVENADGSYSETAPAETGNLSNYVVAPVSGYSEDTYTASYPHAFKDSNGDVRVYWSEGQAISGGTDTIYELVYSGATVTGPTAVGTRTGSGRQEIIVHELSSGDMEMFYFGREISPDDRTNGTYRRTRPSGGSWGAASLFLPGDLRSVVTWRAHGNINKVRGGKDELFATFFENSFDPERTSETLGEFDGPEADRMAGNCLGRAYGTGGFVSGGVFYPDDDAFRYVAMQMDFSRWPGSDPSTDESYFLNPIRLKGTASVVNGRLVSGSDGYIDWPSSPWLDRIKQDRDFCWEFGRVEFDDFAARHMFFGNYDWDNDEASYLIVISDTGDVLLRMNADGAFGWDEYDLGNIGTATGTPMDLCVQKTGATVALFKDGALGGSQDVPSSGDTFRGYANPVAFGSSSVSTQNDKWRGSLKSLRLSIVARYPESGYTPPHTLPRTEPFTSLLTNGDFSDGTTGWAPTDAESLLSVESGGLKVEAEDASAPGALQFYNVNPSQNYRLTYDIVEIGGGATAARLIVQARVTDVDRTSPGTYSVEWAESDGTSDVRLFAIGGVVGAYVIWDNVKLEQI